MEFNPREITLIYNFDKQGDREAIAYANQISDNVREMDISKTPMTESQLAELLTKLGVGVEKIIDVKSDIYRDDYEGKEIEESEWLGILKHNPDLMKTPIGILGDKSIICDLPSHILSLDDKQGFEKNMKT